MASAVDIAHPGVQNFGMMKFRSPAAVMAEQEAKVQQPQPELSVSSLAGYINKCWQSAKEAKQPIEQQMLKNLRQDNGVYEPEKLAAIKAMGGTDCYVLLTATKDRAAEAWINDILRPVGQRPWSIEPTPIPDINPELKFQLEDEVRATFEEVAARVAALGGTIDIPEFREEVRNYTETRYDELLEEVREEARERSLRMADKIDDQLTEGGWHDAWWAVVSDFVRLKAGIVKGPIVRSQDSGGWQLIGGRWQFATEKKLVVTYDRVSPFDLYPAPDSRHPDDGYLIERIPLTRKGLNELIGVPGYSEENIRAAIRDYGLGGKREQLPIDAQRAMFDFGSTRSLYDSDKMDGLEFWGSVPGRLLIEWGLSAGIDAEMEYEINAIMVGHYVIRAILNPDKLGRKPYSVDSFQRVPGSFWGKGVPELMADVQDVCNSVARCIVNNSMLASGPMVEINRDRCMDNQAFHPWMKFSSTNQQMSDAPAVRFYQPQIITGPLLQVFEAFSTMAEDQTGIPRWAYANTNMQGAGATSSGLSMLMSSASRNVKEAISHLDRMIEGIIGRTYDYNMMYDPDEDLKGDAKVVARGSASYLAKEQKAIRLNEALATTNNPTDLQIMGLEGRAKILKSVFRELAPEMEIIPDDHKLMKLIGQIEQQQAAALAQQGTSPMGGSQPGSGVTPPAKPRTLDGAGNPAGGTDVNTERAAA